MAVVCAVVCVSRVCIALSICLCVYASMGALTNGVLKSVINVPLYHHRDVNIP